MRALQVTLFVLGTLMFLVALAVAGRELGDILWRVGIAVMLIDLVMMRLWPTASARGAV